jgi:hypothetical protein
VFSLAAIGGDRVAVIELAIIRRQPTPILNPHVAINLYFMVRKMKANSVRCSHRAPLGYRRAGGARVHWFVAEELGKENLHQLFQRPQKEGEEIPFTRAFAELRVIIQQSMPSEGLCGIRAWRGLLAVSSFFVVCASSLHVFPL